MVRESTSKMKNGKAAGPLGIVSEMVTAAGEAGLFLIQCLGMSYDGLCGN